MMSSGYLKIAKIVVSTGILLFLFYQIDPATLLDQFLNLSVYVFLLAFGLLFSQSLLSAYKWQIILKTEGLWAPYLYLLKSYLIGNFLSLFLPSSFGGDVYRIYALKKYSPDNFQNTSSVLFDRITGLFALLSISLFSFAFFYKSVLDERIYLVYTFVIATFIVMTSRWFLRFSEKYPSKLIQFPRKILLSFSRYKSNLYILAIILFISLVFQSNIVLLNKVFAMALNIEIDLLYLYMIIPLVFLTEALPISINGLGVREGTLVVFMQQAGFSTEQGLALGLLVISARYLYIVPLGGILFFAEMMKAKGISKSKPPHSFKAI